MTKENEGNSQNLSPLQKAHAKMREKREAGIEIVRLNPIQRAKLKPNSLRLAVNAKCFDCCNEQRVEIKKCTIRECSLWAVRPYQNEQEVDEEGDHDDDGVMDE